MVRRLVACLCLVAAACGRAPAGREQRDFERMRQQQRYDAYGPSKFFKNGAVMQPPPAHTVARPVDLPWSGSIEPLAALTGQAGSSDVSDPPLSMDRATLAAGAEQFSISCAPCHGAGGYSGGVMAPNLSAKRPPSLRTPPVATLPAGTVFKVITDGFGRMPPYGWQMPVRTRWAVVAYVKSLTSLGSTPATRSDSAWAAYLHLHDSLPGADVLMSLPTRDTTPP